MLKINAMNKIAKATWHNLHITNTKPASVNSEAGVASSPQRGVRSPVCLSDWYRRWWSLLQTLQWRDTRSASGRTEMTAGWWNCQSRSPPTWSHRRNHQICGRMAKDDIKIRAGKSEKCMKCIDVYESHILKALVYVWRKPVFQTGCKGTTSPLLILKQIQVNFRKK